MVHYREDDPQPKVKPSNKRRTRKYPHDKVYETIDKIEVICSALNMIPRGCEPGCNLSDPDDPYNPNAICHLSDNMIDKLFNYILAMDNSESSQYSMDVLCNGTQLIGHRA